MNFSIRAIIRRLLAPQHRLSSSPELWRNLCADLRVRGNDATRESGAFLLGLRDGNRARIIEYLLYDDLDPHCLDTGIVHFDGRFFDGLWARCEKTGLTVVADVHVHPSGSGQSLSDRNHPMISQAGHLALIIPYFAKDPVQISQTGIYRYLGGKQWQTIAPRDRPKFFHVGI